MKKTMKKIVALGSGAALLVTASVMGTMAWLQDSDAVTNTFTVGNVTITLNEAPVDANGQATDGDRVQANAYKLIPGKTYDKDPTVTVEAGSEDCYVYVEVENGIVDLEGETKIADQMATNWILVDGNVYRYNDVLSAGETAVVFETFTIDDQADVSTVTEDTKISINAFAIQSNEITLETANTEATNYFAAN